MLEKNHLYTLLVHFDQKLKNPIQAQLSRKQKTVFPENVIKTKRS